MDISLAEFLDPTTDTNQRHVRLEIRGKVLSGLDQGIFTFADTSKQIVEIRIMSNQNTNLILPGKYVKLVKPKKSTNGNSLVLNEASRVFPTRKMKELEDLEYQDPNSNPGNISMKVSNVKEMNPDEVSSMLY